jgi:hypothetical protein
MIKEENWSNLSNFRRVGAYEACMLQSKLRRIPKVHEESLGAPTKSVFDEIRSGS